jgi:feruloyl esterase
VLSTNAMRAALSAGYATASTDGGHQGNNPSFITGHPEKVIDFGYRAVHEMTVAAKAIVKAYYGNAPKYSYFNGCSTGGRQAMAELQRYPNDYDGIVAGDPVYDSSRIQGTQLWLWQLFHKDEASNIPREKLQLLHDAVMKSCDGLDRVKDGVLEDPTRCGYEPAQLLCKGADAPDCLTAAQVEAARQSYLGPLEDKTGRQIFPAREWGSEMGWLNHSGKEPSSYAADLYRYLVFRDATWDYRQFDLERNLPRAQSALKDAMDFTDPNIGAFFAHGGKLIQYHGWNDPGVAPQGSINYYRAVAQALGGVSAIDASYRLFMVPGMGHCGGGDGTSTFNMMDALEQWVEQKQAPDFIPASRVVDGKVVRTRPLCPYPEVASYRGQGSTDEAPNFVCRVP